MMNECSTRRVTFDGMSLWGDIIFSVLVVSSAGAAAVERLKLAM
jgi:hypothetical protein